MKQLIYELDDSLGKSAYATKGHSERSISVFPMPDYDFISQVTIERVVTFCRNHHFHYLIDFTEKCIDVYDPAFLVESI